MDKKMNSQTIGCDVHSCAYHSAGNKACSLQSITVAPCTNCASGRPEDESMCSNYKCR